MIDFVLKHWSALLPGAAVTATVWATTVPLFISLGLALALLRISRIGPLAALAVVFVEVVRGLPLIVLMFWIFYALPFVGITLPSLPAGVIALALNFGAYSSEIFRAGIQTVPTGQTDAAKVLGMSRATMLRHIILPQALVIIVPAVGNQLIELFKATSILSLIAAADVVLKGRDLLTETLNATGVWLLVGMFYFALCFPASLAISSVQQRIYRPQAR